MQFRRDQPVEAVPPRHKDVPRISIAHLETLPQGSTGSTEDEELVQEPFADESTMQVESMPPPLVTGRRRARAVMVALVVGLLAAVLGAGGSYLVFRLTGDAATGGLLVELEPATAELRVDGTRRLQTGSIRAIDKLPAPGQVRLTASQHGCQPLTRLVSVERGRVKQVRLELDCK